MTNSLCASMASLKSESLHDEPQPNSPNESSASESKKTASASCETELNHLKPPRVRLHGCKYDHLDGEDEVQSPDNSLWESFFSDQLETDFMICSPVRNASSPQNFSLYNNYNYVQAMQGQSVSGCSPPRFSSQIGSYASSLKGKGLSPLHKVCNSPDNQYMQSIEGLSLPVIEEFLEDYLKDGLEGEFSSSKLSDHIGSTSRSFDISPRLSAMQDIMTSNSSGFCGLVSDTASLHGDGSQLSQESDVNYKVGSIGSGRPLFEALKQEHQQEKQQRRQHQRQPQPQLQLHKSLSQSFMAPLSIDTEQDQDSGLQLVHLLLACAEAVAKEDYMLARRYLHHLNRVATPLGDSMQRVASCFTEALSARLAATLTIEPSMSSVPKPHITFFPPNSLEILKIYQIVYQACPYVKFAHFTANQAIFEAFEAEERVHVIDLDILQGYQWPAFMQALAARPGGAPFLRITGIGLSIESVEETGRCLTELAHSLHVPFEFHPVGKLLQDLKPDMFHRRVGEALAVNSVNRFHRVPVTCLGNLLAMIRDQAPKIFTFVEQEASHNGPYFLGRFLEALHYYSAMFDSLDATFPPDSAQRAKVEQYIFAPEIRNIVACEGAERIERHERLEKWRKIMEGKGFQGIPLSANAVTQSQILLGLYSCDGYKLTEDKGCLLLGWQDRALVAASAWRC